MVHYILSMLEALGSIHSSHKNDMFKMMTIALYWGAD